MPPPVTIAREVQSQTGPALVDVRTPCEHEATHVAGDMNVPLNQLAARIQELPRDRAVLVYCAGGYRSSIAASLLQREGFSGVSEKAASRRGKRRGCRSTATPPKPKAIDDRRTTPGSKP